MRGDRWVGWEPAPQAGRGGGRLPRERRGAVNAPFMSDSGKHGRGGICISLISLGFWLGWPGREGGILKPHF